MTPSAPEFRDRDGEHESHDEARRHLLLRLLESRGRCPVGLDSRELFDRLAERREHLIRIHLAPRFRGFHSPIDITGARHEVLAVDRPIARLQNEELAKLAKEPSSPDVKRKPIREENLSKLPEGHLFFVNCPFANVAQATAVVSGLASS